MISFRVFLWTFQSVLLFGTFSKPVSAQNVSELCRYSTAQFITYGGYEAETYNVTTEDGYILKLFRCFSKKFANKSRKPVMLMHGLLSSSDVFTLNPGNQSLAFLLADLGFDVFLPNSRGNVYSRQHVTKNPDDPSSGFWNFTWNEMGTLDHPATIDFILSKTKFKKLNYIGFSQGTTSMLVLLSSKPEYNSKINIISLMAPIAFVRDVGYKVKAFYEPFLSLRGKLNTEFLVSNRFYLELYSSLCPGDGCDLSMTVAQTNSTMAPLYACRQSGASVNQFMHYGECMKYDYFGEFVSDTINPAAFENTNNYTLSSISTPITLHYSFGDATTSKKNIARLRSQVNSIVYEQTVSDPTFSHGDFALGITANELVYRYIVEAWKKYE